MHVYQLNRLVDDDTVNIHTMGHDTTIPTHTHTHTHTHTRHGSLVSPTQCLIYRAARSLGQSGSGRDGTCVCVCVCVCYRGEWDDSLRKNCVSVSVCGVFDLQGAGWCYDEVDCLGRATIQNGGQFGSSKSWPNISDGWSSGILSASCDENPDFCDYNKVIL
jgi:hypothetical protein